MKPMVPVGARTVTWRVAVAVFFAVGEGFVPALFAGFVDAGRDVCFVDAIHAGAVHADYVEEWFAVDVPAGAGSAGHGVRRRDWFRTRFFFVGSVAGASGSHCSAMRLTLQIGFAAHDGGDAGGVVAAGVAVIGQACGHQQRAEVCVAQALADGSRASCA